MLRTVCLALGSLLSATLLAAPIEVQLQDVGSGRSPSLGQILSYQYAPDEIFEVKLCRDQRTETPCHIGVTVAGFKARRVGIAVRDPHTASVKLAGKASLDANGKWTGEILFKDIGSINLLFMLFDRDGEIIALEGIGLNVKPPKTQLGEQDMRSIYDVGEDTSSSSTGETYYYAPPTFED
jgi:hypothetical protein